MTLSSKQNGFSGKRLSRLRCDRIYADTSTLKPLQNFGFQSSDIFLTAITVGCQKFMDEKVMTE